MATNNMSEINKEEKILIKKGILEIIVFLIFASLAILAVGKLALYIWQTFSINQKDIIAFLYENGSDDATNLCILCIIAMLFAAEGYVVYQIGCLMGAGKRVLKAFILTIKSMVKKKS